MTSEPAAGVTWKPGGRHLRDLPAMCVPCAEEWARWLDFRPPRPLRIIAAAAYDFTAAGVRDNMRARAEDVYGPIRWQQEHLERLCAAGNHIEAAPRTEGVMRWG